MPPQCTKLSLSVVIPSFNGLQLLETNLPPLRQALDYAGCEWEVIVVDDASSDHSVEYLRAEFPWVRVLVNSLNSGFAETINTGIFSATKDIVLALNNDVTVEKDSIIKVLPRFMDSQVFAVTPNILDPRDSRNQAIWRLKPGICWFLDTCLQSVPSSPEIPLFFSSGGSSFYDRLKLREIGGFSKFYAPFYVEDMDLSYQAWKRGWKCLLEPAATVWHPANTTIRMYHKKRKIKFIAAKNKHYFLWLNITDPFLVARYFLFLPLSLLWDLLSFRKYKLVGFFWALIKSSGIIKERQRRLKAAKSSDQDIINHVRQTKYVLKRATSQIETESST